ncbi:MAG TPA: OmpW family outer membrane protein [Acetobacteraceae bacterium]|nr:OmpW family outer membrane protein [Acetobacteraceae bacterium]
MKTATWGSRLAIAGLLAGLPGTAYSQSAVGQPERRWQVDLDITGVLMHAGATVQAAGMDVPGAGASVSNAVTGIFGVSYLLTPHIAVALDAGIPAQATIGGTGSIGSLGTIATTRYGAAVLSVQYRFSGLGRWEPYAAAGVGYAAFFATRGAVVSNAKLSDSWVGSVETGVRYYLDNAWAVRLRIQQLFVGTRISGQLGAVPVTAKVTLNPTVIGAGLSYRF